MDTWLTLLIATPVVWFFVRRYLKSLTVKEAEAKAARSRGASHSEGPRAQHPHIDPSDCIGCGGCINVCPEGDVLAMLGGKAAIVNGHKCIGHSLCAEACPTGAITIVMAEPAMTADMPTLTHEYETNLENLFIAGELGGLALIKNAVSQGRDCIDTIAERVHSKSNDTNVYDVVIVGAGPAGISASLRAIERKLRYITIEQDEIGGTVAKYPRQKLVLTSPVEFPMYGKFKKTELSKEKLLGFWARILERADFEVRSGEKVEDVHKGIDGSFTVVTAHDSYGARAVILALGRTGTPKRLGVPGEELPKVMYRLIEADHYVNKSILVVGGGDSAVEAAMGLAAQPGNKVTLSYRKNSFSRIKDRNLQRIREHMRKGSLQVIFNSNPVEFTQGSAVLEIQGKRHEISNDFVWIFAGGEAPTAFLKKIGVAFGTRDMTLEASLASRTEMRENENGALSHIS